MAIIYKCTNIKNNRVYIGQTIRTLQERIYEHKKELKNSTKNGIWQEDFNIYGIEAFKFESLVEVPNNLELTSLENSYILDYNSIEPNGYNRKLGSSIISSKIPKSKYGNTIDLIFIDLISTCLTNKTICKKYNVPEHVADDILKGTYKKYLSDKYPEDYNILLTIINSSINRISFLQKEKIKLVFQLLLDGRYTHKEISNISQTTINQVHDIARGKTHSWLKDEFKEDYLNFILKIEGKRNREYYISNTDQTIKVTNISSTARILDMDHRRLSELVSGKRKEYMGWKLGKANF